jgi:hypothetical protein
LTKARQAVEDAASDGRVADLLVPTRTGSCGLRMLERVW